jgi:hypothetical protein
LLSYDFGGQPLPHPRLACIAVKANIYLFYREKKDVREGDYSLYQSVERAKEYATGKNKRQQGIE